MLATFSNMNTKTNRQVICQEKIAIQFKKLIILESIT